MNRHGDDADAVDLLAVVGGCELRGEGVIQVLAVALHGQHDRMILGLLQHAGKALSGAHRGSVRGDDVVPDL